MTSNKSQKKPGNGQTTINYPSPPPEAVVQLVSLFEAHQNVLKFPDVDSESLTQAYGEVQSRQLAIEEAAQALSQLCEGMEEARQTLLERARRGHAYATIYAGDGTDYTGDGKEIAERLASIKLGAPLRAPRKRRPTAAKNSDAPTESTESSERASTDQLKTDDASTEDASDVQAAE